MNRTIALLALATLTACQSDRRPPALAAGPTFIQGFDANNNPTLTSYAGRTSAGAGMLNDTTEAGTISDLASRIAPGLELGYAHILKTDIVQPNVESVEKLETDHKEALAAVAKAAAGGIAGDLSKAEDLAKIAGKRLFDRVNAGKGGPKPDSGANSARVFILGKNAGKYTVDAVAEYSGAYKAKQARADYNTSTDTKTTDTSADSSIDSILKTIAEAKRPILPPVAQPPIEIPIPFQSPASTNAPPEIVTGTNVVETIQLPVIE